MSSQIRQVISEAVADRRDLEEARFLLREARALLLYNLEHVTMCRECEAIGNLTDRIVEFLDGRGEVQRTRAERAAFATLKVEAAEAAANIDRAFVSDPTGRPSLLGVRVLLDKVMAIPGADD